MVEVNKDKKKELDRMLEKTLTGENATVRLPLFGGKTLRPTRVNAARAYVLDEIDRRGYDVVAITAHQLSGEPLYAIVKKRRAP